ncbi:hypothetical protein Tco_1279173 [Tanacetum coccineum]
MDTEKPPLKNSNGDDVDVHLYRSMIGSLMYITSSRPDIMFVVSACLWYPKDSPFDMVAYSDSDYAGASLDRKSTTRCYSESNAGLWDKQIEYLMLNASPLKHVKRGRDTKIPQSSGPPIKVGDEAVHKELERTATTASSLEP